MRHIPLAAIRDAAASIYPVVTRTPLVRLPLTPEVSDRLGGTEIYLKLDVLQPIGSFKIRGAYNVIRQMSKEELREGVWTVSAGNAAQGVALAARTAGVPCSVMVMDTTPDAKLQAIRRLGAEIVQVTYDECWKTVESHSSARMRGQLVHPFDDDRFIAGNGTAGLEIHEDLPDVDIVVAPLGGGGLLAGVASALRELRPEAQVYAAEPETAAPFDASLKKGEASYFEGWQASFVDGAGGRSVLPTMWPLLRDLLAGSIVVSLAEVAAAMKLTAERVHVIAEGAAGCAVAAAVCGRVQPRPTLGRPAKVVALVSGGNIDLSRFASLIGACA
jgi:threonine dehydratase